MHVLAVTVATHSKQVSFDTVAHRRYTNCNMHQSRKNSSNGGHMFTVSHQGKSEASDKCEQSCVSMHNASGPGASSLPLGLE